MSRYIFPFVVILLAALSRLLPHPPNVAPITALALFGGAYLSRGYSFIVPAAAMLISDYFLGFHSGMVWVYGSFFAIGVMGLGLHRKRSVSRLAVASLSGSVLFFVVTNFGVWVSSQVTYPKTLMGLLECYAAAIPFFRNTLLGDAFYVSVLFGCFELVRRFFPQADADPHSLHMS